MSGLLGGFLGFLGGGRGDGRPPAGGSRGGAGEDGKLPGPGAGPPFLLEFFFKLRQRGVKVAPHEWMAFLTALEKGAAEEGLLGLYHLGRALLVKSEALFDLYDVAFAEFFRGLEPPKEIAAALEEWLRQGALDGVKLEELIARSKTGLDLDEIIRRFEEKLRTQEERHDGGSQYIGTQGTSPFGRDGKSAEGIRAGGGGGGRGALKVAERRTFRDYRHDRTLDVRQVRVALRRLRDLVREGPEDEVDLDDTVERTGKNGGEIDIAFRRPRKNRVRLLLLMDTGGSMEPYARLCERLFSAASQEKHWRGFQHYYFHNCVYTFVYKDGAFRDRLATERLLSTLDDDWRLVLVGDACMGMGELLSANGSIDWFEPGGHQPGIEWLRRLSARFRRAAWLNPMPRAAWDHPTVRAISVVFPMFELTIDGIDRAVKALKVKG